MSDGAIRAEIGEAIAAVLNRHEAALVTKWIVLVEAVDDEGDRCLWTLAADTLQSWDAFGILTYALNLEQAKGLARYMEPE